MEPLLTYARTIAVARCCLRPWHLSPLRAARPALVPAGLSWLLVALARILLHWGRGSDLCAGPLLVAVTEARASQTHALRRVHVLWSHAALLAAQGRHREAAASCQWATALLPEEGPLAAERAGPLPGQAASLQALGQSGEALSLQQRVLELAGTAGPGCLHVERHAVHAVAESLLGRGDVAGASTHVERGLQRCEQAGVPELERAPLRFLRLRTRWAEGDFEQAAAETEHLAATLTSQPRLLLLGDGEQSR